MYYELVESGDIHTCPAHKLVGLGPIVKRYYTAFVPIYKIFEMFYCYIIKSKINGAYYIGSCENMTKRLNQHNQELVPATKRYSPWDLIYKQEFLTLKEARKRELQIKSWKKRSAIEKLVKIFQKF